MRRRAMVGLGWTGASRVRARVTTTGGLLARSAPGAAGARPGRMNFSAAGIVRRRPTDRMSMTLPCGRAMPCGRGARPAPAASDASRPPLAAPRPESATRPTGRDNREHAAATGRRPQARESIQTRGCADRPPAAPGQPAARVVHQPASGGAWTASWRAAESSLQNASAVGRRAVLDAALGSAGPGGRSDRDQLLRRPQPVARQPYDVLLVPSQPATVFGSPIARFHGFADLSYVRVPVRLRGEIQYNPGLAPVCLN